MAGKSYSIINGKALSAYVQRTNPEFAAEIDPKGINVVYLSMLHNDTDIRAMMLVKIIGTQTPREVTLDFPLDVYNKITATIFDEGSSATPN